MEEPCLEVSPVQEFSPVEEVPPLEEALGVLEVRVLEVGVLEVLWEQGTNRLLHLPRC